VGHQTIGDVAVALHEQGVGAQTMAARLSWAMRCRLAPMKRVAQTIKKHLWGILNAIVLKVSNGPAEGINSRIKMIKVRSRGFRNKQRFANAIYFYLGGLDLYPATALRAGSPTSFGEEPK
jgi:transposase